MEDIIIVIDPGHGGSNEGALYGDYIEKEITMKVATAMKEELDKYEGITTYLTREDDIDLSLQERVDIAKEYDADFIYCLHFNMSAEHTLYGAECWISGFGQNYASGYDFANIEMELLTNLGLFDRGVKTRINKDNEDYYGIIRHATEVNIPSVIIEHCHLDHENDQAFYNQDTWLEAYGRIDATAVAKYYRLKSTILGVDYSTEEIEHVSVPTEIVYPDQTEPEYCRIDSFELDNTTGIAQVKVSAYDSDSRIIYYKYSLDGGETYTGFKSWPSENESNIIEVSIPENEDCNLIFSVDNLYNLSTYSEVYHIPKYTMTILEKEKKEETTEVIPFSEIKEIEESTDIVLAPKMDILTICEIVLLCVLLCITLCLTKWLKKHSTVKKRK